ncbi:DUF1360 domain-containing protein [Cryptosporangium aurantiacum]|uniref:DUF1360 domain-containing protein n=1 Tax=Cryptosporangium aurantiacum TaxID=134849 RepID=A0A1M7RPL1_9ACTN|nr:DUF1360 domain-containing protein [Cryptosporangium aurantiacum]SHN48036.1 Protein of unknown function [Cryptosporangium aurantiacum]
MTDVLPTVRAAASRVAERYARSADDDRPLRGYLTLMGLYGGTVAGLTGLAAVLGRKPPQKVSAGDVALLTAATYKLSRILTKDAITSPLRAPFTQYSASAGEGEVNEEPVAHDPYRHAAGELVNCPFCTSMWVATGLAAGLVLAPGFTRVAATALTAVAGSDLLQFAFTAVREKVE